MSVRKSFISLTTPLSGILPLNILCSLTEHDFILPFYHIVSDEDCPHIKHLYSFKNVKHFESDLDYLASHYQPIKADALPDILAGKYKGKKIMLLTFDDGLRQIYDVVAPMLLRKGIPAVFFLNTDFIDNKALMFRYKASLVTDWGKEQGDIFEVRKDKALQNYIHEPVSEVEIKFDAFLKEYKPYMTSEQIKSLINQGFTIGAHSCSHPYYEDLTLEEQLDETLNCINILTTEFGLKQKLFAFPFTDQGVSKLFFDQIFLDNKTDFSFGGAGIKNDIYTQQFQRIPMEGWNATAEQILKSEYLYYLLRAPFGKNTIKRK